MVLFLPLKSSQFNEIDLLITISESQTVGYLKRDIKWAMRAQKEAIISDGARQVP